MRALLNVNVLIALLDPGHFAAEAAHKYVQREAAAGWASCAITENGAVRILSQPSYGASLSSAAAATLVAGACASDDHEFWPCDISALDDSVVDRRRLLGPNQLTDVYLLALAVAHDGRFVTFDQAVTTNAVRGAESRNLVVL